MFTFEVEAAGNEDLVSKELARELARLQFPASGMKFLSSSPEHMDVASILSLDWRSFTEVIVGAGNISVFCYSMYDIIDKYKAKITIKNNNDISKKLDLNCLPADIQMELESLLQKINKEPR